jgi:hypothetical protein
MHTFLSPIEKPQGLMMKLPYYFIRRQSGKSALSTNANPSSTAAMAAWDVCGPNRRDDDVVVRVNRHPGSS